jgi:hypothetical protein
MNRKTNDENSKPLIWAVWITLVLGALLILFYLIVITSPPDNVEIMQGEVVGNLNLSREDGNRLYLLIKLKSGKTIRIKADNNVPVKEGTPVNLKVITHLGFFKRRYLDRSIPAPTITNDGKIEP